MSRVKHKLGQPCPQCHSSSIRHAIRWGPFFLFLILGFLFTSAGAKSWIAVPFGLAFFCLSLIMTVIPKHLTCIDCNYKWKPKKLQ
ncbi:hypothetical protein [Bacillus infantis]|uniref:hypothetical protein n=1 Tax=Bacillus infantis TaxID=324767 RepID=UPI003CEC45B0